LFLAGSDELGERREELVVPGEFGFEPQRGWKSGRNTSTAPTA
jgi:hypothetical protein